MKNKGKGELHKMSTDTLTQKVENASITEIARAERFTLTGFDSEADAQKTAEALVSFIEDLFQKTYECSPQKADENNYNLNCRLT